MNSTLLADVKGKVTEIEWKIRVDLAACYRLMAHFGMSDLIYNHITARIPGTNDHLLINPYGYMYEEITASSLVKIDLAGNIIGTSEWPVNPAGFTIHAAIHDCIADAHCVMHTHTTAGMAVACSAAGLSMSNFYAVQLHGKLAYHDFEGITVHAEEGPRLIRNIGDKPAVVLRNHGLLAWGDTIPRTFSILWLLNRACEIQLASAAMGPVIELSEEIQRKCTRDSLQFDPAFGAGRDVFEALTRILDRVDTSYRN